MKPSLEMQKANVKFCNNILTLTQELESSAKSANDIQEIHDAHLAEIQKLKTDGAEKLTTSSIKKLEIQFKLSEERFKLADTNLEASVAVIEERTTAELSVKEEQFKEKLHIVN